MADGESQPKPDAAKVKEIRIQTGVVKRTAKDVLSYVKEAEKEAQVVEKMEAEGKDEHDIKLRRNCWEESRNMIKVQGKRLTDARDKLTALMKEVDNDELIKETDEYKKMMEVLEDSKEALAVATQ